MKHIKDYYNKVDNAIALKNKTAPKNKGLLASSKPKDQPQNEMSVIVSFVENIRQSREEMKNG
jgi:hypothetical protein